MAKGEDCDAPNFETDSENPKYTAKSESGSEAPIPSLSVNVQCKECDEFFDQFFGHNFVPESNSFTSGSTGSGKQKYT